MKHEFEGRQMPRLLYLRKDFISLKTSDAHHWGERLKKVLDSSGEWLDSCHKPFRFY